MVYGYTEYEYIAYTSICIGKQVLNLKKEIKIHIIIICEPLLPL